MTTLRALAGAARRAGLPLRQAPLRAARRTLCDSLRRSMDPVVPSPDRTVDAFVRPDGELGSRWSAKLREEGKLPVALMGDRQPNLNLWLRKADLDPMLNRTHFQRELLTLNVEGGETVRVLPQEIQADTLDVGWKVLHVDFRRWPREPERHPVKLNVPVIYINDDAVPQVRTGGYIYDMFSNGGLPCYVRDAEHVPRFLVGDMRRADGNDLRREHLDLPPGVTVRRTNFTELNDGNFLVARAKRVKG